MPHELESAHPLDAAGLVLVRAEEAIALVARATPRNARTEIQRLGALAARRGGLRPAFEYGPPIDLSEVRRGLERVARVSLEHGRIGALHAARTEELELEARLVEHVGQPRFAELAARRFRAPLGALHESSMDFVDRALGEAPSMSASSSVAVDGVSRGGAGAPPTSKTAAGAPPTSKTAAGAPPTSKTAAGAPPTNKTAAPSTHVMSDDLASPASLVNKVARLARELGLPIRVETRPDQLAIAATGHGLVAVRPGVRLSAETASRIALHEIVGHALPRMRSRHAPWSLFRAGTAGSVEGEEGRALLVERRAGHLDRARRRELAFRHLGALGVRRGADFEETFRELVARGAEASEAVEIAVRVHRGGGLGREVVYLPAYHEVRRAFDREPDLERWFERGRIGLEAARVFAALGDARDETRVAGGPAGAAHSSNSMNTGA